MHRNTLALAADRVCRDSTVQGQGECLGFVLLYDLSRRLSKALLGGSGACKLSAMRACLMRGRRRAVR